MHGLEVAVTTDGEGAEAVAKALRPFAHDQRVVFEQLGDHQTENLCAFGRKVAVKIYVTGNTDTPVLRRRLSEILYYLGRLYPLPAPVFNELQETAWSNAQKERYQPFRIGTRLLVQPNCQEVADTQGNDIVLSLDAGTAFGTGLHPTTHMCLLALEALAQPRMRVLDVGAGSGILAIAAAKLGATEVFGVDTDELAVKAAREHVILNGVGQWVAIEPGGLPTVTQRHWDIVMVNILAPVIDNLLRKDGLMGYVAARGRLVLGGILQQQTGMIEDAIGVANGHLEHTLTLGKDWTTFVVAHKNR